MGLEKFNPTCQWLVGQFRLDGIASLRFAFGKSATSPISRTPKFSPCHQTILFLRNLSFCFFLTSPGKSATLIVESPSGLRMLSPCVFKALTEPDGLFLDISTDSCYSFLGSIRKLVSGVAAWGFIIRHLQYSLFVSKRTHKICFAGEQALCCPPAFLFFSVIISQHNQPQNSQTHPHGHPHQHGIPSEIRQTHQQTLPLPFPVVFPV